MAEMEANWREKPTMDAAKDHFEEFVSKRIQDQKDSNEYRAAFAGETQNDDDTIKAERYHFFAPATQLDEFGTGISLYFHTVKAVFVMMAICALISILAIVKNNSFNKQYIPGQTPAYAEGTTCPDLLRGSVYGATRNDLRYNYQGAANIAIIAILTAFLFIASSLEARSIQKIDQNLQTTKDYAVEMHNPPTLVTDPEEYHKYFSQFGEVVYISVAVRNGTLLRTLADKVVLQSRLEGLHLRQKWKTYLPYLFPSEEKLRGTLSKLQEQIADIADPSKPPFPVYRVFAIFNTQAAKIDCTDKCAISYVDYLRGETSNPLANFHGNLVQIEEPREPSDTLYDSTDSSFHRRLLFSVISYAFCAATIVVSFFIVVSIQRQGASVAVYLAISNSILPLIISVATLNIEIHTNESFRQVSMLLKLFVMRCINSGVLIFLAVNYEAMFGIAHLDAILGILIADATYTPLLRALDVPRVLVRWGVAPFISNTQAELNSYWEGTDWTLAERYTDLLKTVFVGLFFLVLIPYSLFITTFAMLATYIVDKYCLFNIWRRPPALDGTMSTIARYGFGLTLLAHICSTRVFFANWPYANASDSVPCGFLDCVTNSKMTGDQRKLVYFYNTISSLFFAILLVWVFLFFFGRRIYRAFVPKPTHMSKAKEREFRSIYGANPYIPMIVRLEIEDKILCCDVSRLPFEAITVNIWDQEDELPQDLSVADSRHLPFLPGDEDAKAKRISELFGQVIFYGPNGEAVRDKTTRPNQTQIREHRSPRGGDTTGEEIKDREVIRDDVTKHANADIV